MASAGQNRKLVPFKEADDFSDLVLVAGKVKLHVNRAVLCMASPVFKAMLTRDFKEKNAAQLDLPDDDPLALRELLQLISPVHYSLITAQNLPLVLPLADKYQVVHLVDICEEQLLNFLPEHFGLREKAQYLCMSDWISEMSAKACKVEISNYLKTACFPSWVSATSIPWWCVLLLVYHVAKLYNLRKLRKEVWRMLMCTSGSSVWCSSVSARSTSLGILQSSELRFSSVSRSGGDGLSLRLSSSVQYTFTLIGVENNPFFKTLEAKEQVDILLAWNTFLSACKISCN